MQPATPDKFRSSKEALPAMERAVTQLLESVRLSAVEIGPVNRRKFLEEIATVEHRVQMACSPQEISQAIDGAAESLGGYNRGVATGFQAALEEYNKLSCELLQTIDRIAGPSEQASGNLKQVEMLLGSAKRLEELRAIRQQVAACTSQICDGVARRRDDVTRQITTLRAQLQRRDAIDSGVAVSGSDGAAAMPAVARPVITHGAGVLPNRISALTQMAQAIAGHTRCFAGVLHLDRYPSLARRYGAPLLDRLQRLVGRELASRLPANDRLFQWGPGTFAVLLERTEPADAVFAEFRRATGLQGARALEIESRTLILPVSFVSTLIPVFEMSSTEAIVRRVDTFLAEYADR